MDTDLLLKNIEKHIQLDPDEKDFFLSLLHPKRLKRQEFLLHRGEICQMESFVSKGCVRIYTIDENGFEHIQLFGVEDWWVGDLYSFLTGYKTAYFIDALEDTELLQLSKADLNRLYDRVPKFERFFRLLFQNAYVAQQQRIDQGLSFNAEQRYLSFIKKYPTFEQRIPQKQIAAYLGITPVFLSMLKKRLSTR